MKSLSFSLVLCGLCSWIGSPASAATITAVANSNTSVQTAINSAASGDEVVIPSGSVTWTAGITISGKGIYLRSVAPGALTITHGAGGATLIHADSDASRSVEIGGINFLAGSATGNYMDLGGGGKVPLLHDCTFQLPNFQLFNAVRFTRTGGVVYNCAFNSNDRNGSGSGCLQLLATGSGNSWTTPSTMGAADVTGTMNTYIEDCTFFNMINQCIDVDNNIRAVIRHCTFSDSQITVHGADTSSDGGRHYEIYDNIFIFTPTGSAANYPLSVNRFAFLRGGTGIITGNVLPNIQSQMWGDKPEMVAILMNAQHRAGPYPCPQLSDYPVPHQIGQSYESGRVTDPLYMWGNTGTSDQQIHLSDYGTDECGLGLSSSDFIKNGRDFIVGSPKPGYTKYVYPHPSRRPKPSAPQNLRIIAP